MGGGLYLASVATTALILFLLTVVKPVERRIVQRRQLRRPIMVLMDRQVGCLAAVETAARNAKVRLERIHIRPSSESDSVDQVELTLGGGTSPTVMLTLLDNLRSVPGVQEITASSPYPTASAKASSASGGGAFEPAA